MEIAGGGFEAVALPPGEAFFDELAERFLEECVPEKEGGDLSAWRVLVPALPMAIELRAALVRACRKSLLLPHFDTLRNWVVSSPLDEIPDPLPESERLILLHEALRDKGWFDETALWGIASEMAGLFDELTAAAVQLPDGEAELARQLQRAYALRASAPLAFEARVVHELWKALSAAGAPDAAAVYRLRLAGLARLAARQDAPQPLLVLLDAAPDESLEPTERDFLGCYGATQPLHVFFPAPRESRVMPLLATLDAAWPREMEAPLFERAQELAWQYPVSPLGERLQFVPAMGREQEAQAAVAQVGEWLQTGLRRIALIAQDRLTARRVRALLERENVLVSDETGWLLSTSRAAAAVDSVIETAAGNAYHRDLLDLCKSPFVFSDIPEDGCKRAIFSLETVIREASVKSGLPSIRRCFLQSDVEDKSSGLALLDRVEAATTLLRSKPTSLASWLGRLHKALDVLGALTPLKNDVAGQALLDLLETRREELIGNTAQFSFNAWRDWLNREFEAASFRDSGIASPVVVTPLNAVCLRRFEAALLLGGDARQLAPAGHGEFFNQSVRRELGLRTREDGERELRRDLELLLAVVPQVTVTWQSMRDGEANLLAPEFSLLSTLHRLAWQDDLHRRPLPSRGEPVPDTTTAPVATQQAAPAAPPELIPQRLSVSGYVSLVACPYRFFVRHVLRLGEMDEVSEEMEKSDYGELVHRVLERFHSQYPVVSACPRNEALEGLQRCVDEVFGPAVEANFLATGWRLRWEKHLVDYLDWQRGQEAKGWRWFGAEMRVSRVLQLDNGELVELYGRIDRIDRNENGAAGVALYDYKTQSAKSIKDRLKDDVQLPAYALMHGNATTAAYVALDDESVAAMTCGSEDHPLMGEAEAQGRRLSRSFSAVHAGAPLPAHGVDSVCQWCEASGLCRKGYV